MSLSRGGTHCRADPVWTMSISNIQPYRASFAPGVVVIAAFGPYLWGGGLRTEQVVIYALALPAALKVMRTDAARAWAPPYGLWASLIAIVAIVGLSPPPGAREGISAYLAGLDNLLMPLAAALVALGWLARGFTAHITMMRIAGTLITVLALNSLVMLYQVVFSTPSWFGLFWGPTGAIDVSTVAGRALGNARVTGIFNQPLEAGICYSLGLLSAVYWAHFRRPTMRHLILGALLLVGGILPVSKIFLFLGVPLAAIMVVQFKRYRQTRIAVGAIIAAGPMIWFLALAGWDGIDRTLAALRWGERENTLAAFYSAGRYGEAGTLAPVVDQTMSESAWLGYGASGISLPYDSAYVEMLVLGGLLALALYSLLIAMLFLTYKAWQHGPMRIFSMALLVFMTLSGLGAPTMTANRAGSLLVLLLVVTFGERFAPSNRGAPVSGNLRAPSARHL